MHFSQAVVVQVEEQKCDQNPYELSSVSIINSYMCLCLIKKLRVGVQ